MAGERGGGWGARWKCCKGRGRGRGGDAFAELETVCLRCDTDRAGGRGDTQGRGANGVSGVDGVEAGVLAHACSFCNHQTTFVSQDAN
jgi:hypothetical protein